MREKKTDGEGIKTALRELMRELLAGPPVAPAAAPMLGEAAVDITDAAMLMAADGYGHGKVIGEHNGEEVVIRTSDTHKSFLHPKEPVPAELATAAARLFKAISDERHMEH